MNKHFFLLIILTFTSCSFDGLYYGLDFSVDLPAGVSTPRQVFTWTAQNIAYDFEHAEIQAEKAEKTTDDFWQTPKETMARKLGVCIDYASLDVAMLQALGYDASIVLTHLPGSSISTHACVLLQGKTYEAETGEAVEYPLDTVFTWKQFQELVDFIPNNMRTH